MKKILLITLLLPTLNSCKKKQIIEEKEYNPIQIPCTLSKNLDTARLYIQGTWEWLEEKRFSRFYHKILYLTPENQEYTLTMKLDNDTVRFFSNNQPDSVYTYKVVLLKEISGTNFPEDNIPILAFYKLHNGLRSSHVPLKICSSYLLLQHQYVSSIVGERIWKKQ